jgi:hypothetical protein
MILYFHAHIMSFGELARAVQGFRQTPHCRAVCKLEI